MRKLGISIVLLLVIIVAVTPLEGQLIGIPHIQNYSTKVYHQHEQNWTITQDRRGIIYVGNTNGLLEYDGTTWRLLKTWSPDVVRSVTVGPDNEIYAGGFNYFGQFMENVQGRLEFYPISEQLPPIQKRFGNVWNIHCFRNAVYFQTDSALFRWSEEKFSYWKTTFPMNRSFLIGDHLYLVQKNKGLMELTDDVLVPVAGGNIFAHEKIMAMIALDKHRNLIGTRNLGLFIQTPEGIEPFSTEIEVFFKREQLTGLAVLKNGQIAVSSIKKGIAVIDTLGRLILSLDKQKGLMNNTVWSLFADDQYGLWLALNNGICRVEIPSPVTYLNEKSGIEATVESIAEFQGKLYFATPLGIYFTDPRDRSARIQKIPDFRPYKLAANRDHLLASGYNSGIYALRDNDMVRIAAYTGYSFLVSKRDPNRIYIGLTHGIAALYDKNGRWVDEGFLELDTSPIRRFAELPNGDLWLGSSGPALYRLRFSDNGFRLPDAAVDRFESGRGLDQTGQNYVFGNEGDVIVANGANLLTYDEQADRFVPYHPLADIISDTTAEVYHISPDTEGNLWILLNSGNGYQVVKAAGKPGGAYELESMPYLPLAGSFFYAVSPDPANKNISWFAGPDGVVRFDAEVEKNYQIVFPCLVRQVKTVRDSVLWDRNMAASGSGFEMAHALPLDYENNGFRLEFSTPFYEHEGENRYQFLLEGFETNWSEWTDDHRTTFTNIPEGEYIFRVRAQNIFGNISREGRFRFRILPPWYRTYWMYGAYILLFGLVSFGLVRYRSSRIEKEKKTLENIINDRTAEIQSKNRQLARQTEKLKELDVLKSRFFSNISHEFRTPLTLIIGPMEQMLNNTFKGDRNKMYEIILRNARQVLRLINQLLDLSKLESGNLQLQASLQPIAPFLRSIVFSFSSLAESKKIHLEFIDSTENLEIYFDTDMLEKIMYNLLSNAFKFTPSNGVITVTLDAVGGADPGADFESVQIRVHDSGVGIPEEHLAMIFDRFSQGGNQRASEHAGSGIGLALVKELVVLHHGEINVKSEVGKGSEFDIMLPMGKAHLQPAELKDLSQVPVGSQKLIDLELAGMGVGESTGDASEDLQSIKADEDIMVLVIDDNADVRSFISMQLTGQFQIIEAENGREGARYARELLPDLIICDVMMPEMDGYELCRQIKNDPLVGHIPVIMLTAKAADEDRIKGLTYGADAYLTKPFNSQELQVRVMNLITGRRKLREKFKRDILQDPSEINRDSLEDQLLRKVRDLIDTRMSDPSFSIDDILNEMAISQRQFYRKIQALTGQTPGQFIRTMRLKRAMQLLKNKSGSVTQIAYDVGFSNLSYFSKCFREQFGRLPSEIGK